MWPRILIVAGDRPPDRFLESRTPSAQSRSSTGRRIPRYVTPSSFEGDLRKDHQTERRIRVRGDLAPGLRREFGHVLQVEESAGGRMGDRRTGGTDGLPPKAQR